MRLRQPSREGGVTHGKRTPCLAFALIPRPVMPPSRPAPRQLVAHLAGPITTAASRLAGSVGIAVEPVNIQAAI